MMMRTIFVAAAALASVSVSPGHAESAAAPYCAVIELGPGSVYWDCQYSSFDDCYRRGNILAGNRGFCNPSPYYVAGYAEQKGKKPRETPRLPSFRGDFAPFFQTARRLTDAAPTR